MDERIVIDEFFVVGAHVIVFQDELGANIFKKAYLGDEEIPFTPNSIRTWLLVKTEKSLLGKTIEFR